MGRWHPDARGRLEEAAYELYRDRGYDVTTVADIAARAGLTERTFFRHFADKREVLFSGSSVLQDAVLRGLESVSPERPTVEAVRAAVEAAAALMQGRRALARERHAVVTAHPDLQERELIKRAKMTAALAEALRARGVAEPAASLSADVGMGVFYVGFVRWLDDPAEREYLDVVREGFDQLKAFAG